MPPSRRFGRQLPLAYLVFGCLAMLAVLPSALRPPPDEAQQSAQFSPDAPPDQDPEAIIQSLRQAASQTAGATGQDPDVGAGRVGQVGPVVPTTVVRAPAKSVCFGSPARTTESYYSGPCVAAFVGDNGGATWSGVTADQINVGFSAHPIAGWDDCIPDGPVPVEPRTGECDAERTVRVYQQYFNEKFEFYGRRIQFWVYKQDATVEKQKAAATSIANVPSFAAVNNGDAAVELLVQRGVINWGTDGNAREWMYKNSPYAWSFMMDGDTRIKLQSELACKQLAGRPPEFNERLDQTFDYNAPRVFGLLEFEDSTHYNAGSLYESELAKCGATIAARSKFNLTSNAQAIAGAITRLRSEGVTTIICYCDLVSIASFTQEADGQRYYPEWMMGGGGTELNSFAQLYSPTQWRHALGIGSIEIARPRAATDWWRAYKEIDPTRNPQTDIGGYFFYEAMQIANGIQAAGPTLTPQSFMAGLRSIPRHAPEPVWSNGGGYGPGDYAYTDYASLVWWDPDAIDPGNGAPGAYRHTAGGKRYTGGEIPTSRVRFFEDGIASPANP